MNGRAAKKLRKMLFPKKIREAERAQSDSVRDRTIKEYEKKHGKPPAENMKLTFTGHRRINQYRKIYRSAKQLYSGKDKKFLSALSSAYPTGSSSNKKSGPNEKQ